MEVNPEKVIDILKSKLANAEGNSALIEAAYLESQEREAALRAELAAAKLELEKIRESQLANVEVAKPARPKAVKGAD